MLFFMLFFMLMPSEMEYDNRVQTMPLPMSECDGYVCYDARLKRSTAVRSDMLSRI